MPKSSKKVEQATGYPGKILCTGPCLQASCQLQELLKNRPIQIYVQSLHHADTAQRKLLYRRWEGVCSGKWNIIRDNFC